VNKISEEVLVVVMEQRAVEPVRVDSVRVLSWNLWCHLFVGGAEPSARLARFACVVEEIKPDIVCVQEVFEGKAVFVSMTTLLNQLSQTMEMFGYTMVRSRATVPWLYGQDSGLVSFVKHRKVVSHETVKFEKLS
jgi:endonuclease/exonuclease/phosphatase family metal-dependent hydrolase